MISVVRPFPRCRKSYLPMEPEAKMVPGTYTVPYFVSRVSASTVFMYE